MSLLCFIILVLEIKSILLILAPCALLGFRWVKSSTLLKKNDVTLRSLVVTLDHQSYYCLVINLLRHKEHLGNITMDLVFLVRRPA